MTVSEALRLGERQLADAGVDTPRVDAELLLAHVLGTSRSGVYARAEREVPGTYQVLLGRRCRREPLAYVLGEWGFRRLVLKTDARTLVPRPETEIVVERCLEPWRPPRTGRLEKSWLTWISRGSRKEPLSGPPRLHVAAPVGVSTR